MIPPLLLALAVLPASRPSHAAEVSGLEYREALKALSEAEGSLDSKKFLEAFSTVLRVDDAKALRAALSAYAKLAPALVTKAGLREFMWLNGKAAGAFAALKSEQSVKEFKSLLLRSKDWHSRLLLLNACSFVEQVSLLEMCLQALRDDSPIVVRRALQYLRRAEKPEVVEKIIQRAVEISETKTKGPDKAQWERVVLNFQSTLRQMLKVDLFSPQDYKNYFESRKTDPNLFDPKKSLGDETTGLTLFGAAVTGKNIAFVLDVSGSMTTRDPSDAAEQVSERGRTGVGEAPKESGPRLPPISRQRMHRAKKELCKVVRALPYDVRFNIIPYASEVKAWKRSMVQATDANKKSAVAFVEKLNAEGITYTDAALEEAFLDMDLDTIYLLTDGAPTHVGNTVAGGVASGGVAPGAFRGEKPPDSDEIIKEIHERMAELNFLRGVRIFTLGFEGAEETFLKKLSADHGGAYVRIR